MKINENDELIINQLIDITYPTDSKENTKRNKQLKERDPEELRKIGRVGDNTFTSDELLLIDFSSIEKLKELIDSNKKEEVFELLKELDFDTLIYIGQMARKRKLNEILYKMCIGNLSSFNDFFDEELEMVNYKVSKKKKGKRVLLEPTDDK